METGEVKSVKDDVWIPTVCAMCYNCCAIKVHRVNGAVVNIEGNSDCPQGLTSVCAKGKAGIMSLYSPNRLKVPLKRTNPEKGIGVDPKWVEISWDEALDTIAQKLKKVKADDPRKLNMVSFDTDLMRVGLMGAFAAAFGTPNVNLSLAAALFCGNSLHPVALSVHGAIHMEPDLHHCKYLILIGAQHGFMVGENAMVYSLPMAEAQASGTKVVVVDPICTQAAAKAGEWLPIRPGTDGAFALALVNVLLNELGIYDAEFLKRHTNAPYLVGPDGHYLRDGATNKPVIWDSVEGKTKTYDSPDIKDFALEGRYEVNGIRASPAFQLVKEHVKKFTCEEVSKITTIPAETMRRIAREFGEAARIGSKIVLGGKELPYRPACVYFRRGANAHKHAMLAGFAIELLNMVVGAVDVPGGSLGANPTFLPTNIARWSWMPREGPDGMLIPGVGMRFIPYAGREAKRPQMLTMHELFPVATYSDSLMLLNIMNPERFNFPYKAEILQHNQTNIMMSTVDPKIMAEWLKKFSFHYCFAREINEAVEFADVVLPDSDYLERIEAVTPWNIEVSGTGLGEWCILLRQPVVEPPLGVKSRTEVLFEIADRVGILKDFLHMLNVIHKFEEPYKLDVNKQYTFEEFLDIWAKSRFGAEHDLAWFKKHGFISWPKRVEETYFMPFTKARVPIYLENFLKAGEDVKRVTEEMGISWDVSDYQALPDWKPCPPYEQKSQEYDLYAVNYKVPFHTWSNTTENIWLNEIGEYHPYAYYILINSQIARKKGIKDGDLVCLQTETGNQVKGKVRVTNTVHPEVVGIAGTFGHWAKELPISKGKGVHYNSLIPVNLECIDMVSSAIDCCIKVKVFKVS